MEGEIILALAIPFCIVVYVVYSYLTHKEK